MPEPPDGPSAVRELPAGQSVAPAGPRRPGIVADAPAGRLHSLQPLCFCGRFSAESSVRAGGAKRMSMSDVTTTAATTVGVSTTG